MNRNNEKNRSGIVILAISKKIFALNADINCNYEILSILVTAKFNKKWIYFYCVFVPPNANLISYIQFFAAVEKRVLDNVNFNFR